MNQFYKIINEYKICNFLGYDFEKDQDRLEHQCFDDFEYNEVNQHIAQKIEYTIQYFESLLEKHHMYLMKTSKGYVVKSNDWKKASHAILETMNGVGYFTAPLHNLNECRTTLISRPFSYKNLALSHLGWITDYAEVYGDKSLNEYLERKMRYG